VQRPREKENAVAPRKKAALRNAVAPRKKAVVRNAAALRKKAALRNAAAPRNEKDKQSFALKATFFIFLL
jgi:hypothetical protein